MSVKAAIKIGRYNLDIVPSATARGPRCDGNVHKTYLSVPESDKLPNDKKRPEKINVSSLHKYLQFRTAMSNASYVDRSGELPTSR